MRLIFLSFFLLMHIAADARRSRIDSILVKIQTDLPDSVKAGALYQLSKDYLNINGDSSVYFGEKAVALAEKINLRRIIAEGNAVLGANEKNKGNHEKAIQHHLKALKIKEEDNNEKGLAVTYNDIGVLYKTMGRFDEALSYYKKANELCKKLGFLPGIALTYNNIGTIHRETPNPDSALYYYQLALSVAEQTGDPYTISVCLSNVGDVYEGQGKYAQALQMFSTCLAYDKQIEDMTGIATTYNNIARTLSSMKQYDRAYAYSDSALQTVLSGGLHYERMHVLMVRAGIEEAMGKASVAVTTMRQYIALKDSLMTEETNNQVSELQTKYETTKKEQQIALQQSALREKNLLILAIAVFVTLLALLSYSYYRRYRLRQQALLQQTVLQQQEMANKAVIEAEERERKRIASDLHDGVGQLMSAAKMNLSLMAGELKFKDTEQQEAFSKAMELVDEGCREVRTVSHNILPNALLKAGLAVAIREFINKIDQRVLKVNLYSEGLNERIEGHTESVLYRIIQECVNNAIKHSGASQLDIAIIKDQENIAVTIEDNGKGFDLSDRSKFEGIGLQNIQSRVNYLNGTLEWDTAPGKGTVVMVHVPASSQNKD